MNNPRSLVKSYKIQRKLDWINWNIGLIQPNRNQTIYPWSHETNSLADPTKLTEEI